MQHRPAADAHLQSVLHGAGRAIWRNNSVSGLLRRKCFFCNSGAEANEAAIEAHPEIRVPQGRYEIIVFENSFHGRTLGALAATAQPKFHEGFGPLPAGFPVAKMNRIETVEALINPKTAGILIEPIQGEGGINPANADFLKALWELAQSIRWSWPLMAFNAVWAGRAICSVIKPTALNRMS